MSNLEGQYNTIKMSQVISSAKQRLRLETSDDDLFLLRYANEGARHFDSLQTFVKRCCTLTVTNGKAKLPNGFYQLLAIRMNNVPGGIIYVDQPFLQGNGISCGGFGHAGGVCQIQNGYIYLTVSQANPNHGINPVGYCPDPPPPPPNPLLPPTVQTYEITIAFVGMNVDDDGMMVVYSDMERGLVAYCVWMYMLDAPAGKYQAFQIQSNEKIWMNQKSWYKSIQFQNRFRNTRHQVMSIARAWIAAPNLFI